LATVPLSYMRNIHEIFNDNSITTLKNAIFLAAKNNQALKPEHILFSIINQKNCIAAHLLKKINLSSKNKTAATNDGKNKNINLSNFTISPEAARIIEKAILIASTYKHKYIGTEHLLAALLEINDSDTSSLIKNSGINKDQLKNRLKSIFESISNFPAFYPYEPTDDYLEPPEPSMEIPFKKASIKTGKKSYLDNFCTELTNQCFQQNVDPVIGREKEIARIIQILARRNKNNPVLIGEAGVGKTAIIEGLAKKIILGQVPSILLKKKILSLDINSLVAGTVFRGEFEGRLKNLITELSKNKDIIIFIDEIHNIIGAGSTSGTLDIANILKPILARGKINFIGATTFSEYKKHIEKDPALERRFQPIIIKEPSVEHSIKILEGIKPNYENFHKLNISSSAIEAAVKLSNRYIQDRLLPDKAIDLLDETASKYKIEKNNDDTAYKIQEIESILKNMAKEKEKYVMTENFEMAIKCKNKEIKYHNQLRKLKDNFKKIKKEGQITPQDVYTTISEIINIPEKDINSSDFNFNMQEIKAKLNSRIIAQTEVIGKISNALTRGFAGISNSNRPLGSFLFLGPSGVGKSELAKTLAKTLFTDNQSLIRIDMSEYAESFNISKLIGAPAGYVGFEQGGMLTEKVRRNPHSIILFDELEKGHKSLFNILLQILEDGTTTDASGREINFKNTIIIMTSNLALNKFTRRDNIGFELNKEKNINEEYGKLKKEVNKEVENFLPQELINRIDDILIFNQLQKKDIKKIVLLNIAELKKKLQDKNIKLTFDEELINYLTEKSISLKEGARLIRKIIQSEIEDTLAQKIMDKSVLPGDKLILSYNEKNVEFKKNNG